jgi:hypothetical protein
MYREFIKVVRNLVWRTNKIPRVSRDEIEEIYLICNKLEPYKDFRMPPHPSWCQGGYWDNRRYLYISPKIIENAFNIWLKEKWVDKVEDILND